MFFSEWLKKRKRTMDSFEETRDVRTRIQRRGCVQSNWRRRGCVQTMLRQWKGVCRQLLGSEKQVKDGHQAWVARRWQPKSNEVLQCAKTWLKLGKTFFFTCDKDRWCASAPSSTWEGEGSTGDVSRLTYSKSSLSERCLHTFRIAFRLMGVQQGWH